MGEIKKSSKGVDYAEPCTLKTKQRVYSQAMLMRIPHHDPENIDISLKIGRYNLQFGRITESNPKSELTLDNEELNTLIAYLSQNYVPIELGAGKYISVEAESAELIEKFKSLIETQQETAQLLIDNDILTENVFVAATAIKKQKALSEFEEKLTETLPESFWQGWFEQNKWILGSDFAQIIDERHIDTENIADYIMKAFDGFVDLVEIKKPNEMLFWASAKDHDNYVPSAELIKAITQCLNYIYAIEQEANSVKFIEKTNSKVIKPRCILIYGRSNNWNAEQREAYRILNAAYNQISILTYDHLLKRAKNVLDIFLPQDDDNDLPF